MGRCHPCLETLEKRAFLEYGNGRQPLDISSFLNQGVLWAGAPVLARLLTVVEGAQQDLRPSVGLGPPCSSSHLPKGFCKEPD